MLKVVSAVNKKSVYIEAEDGILVEEYIGDPFKLSIEEFKKGRKVFDFCLTEQECLFDAIVLKAIVVCMVKDKSLSDASRKKADEVLGLLDSGDDIFKHNEHIEFIKLVKGYMSLDNLSYLKITPKENVVVFVRRCNSIKVFVENNKGDTISKL